MFKSVGAAVAAVALVATPVNAACWNSEETSAATIRELQSMLMVAALRCQVAHHDMTGDYNDFLRANRIVIERMNDRIKAHFLKAAGPVEGQKAYDAFATTLANGYGAAASSEEVCGGMASLAREAGLMAGSEDGLLLLAARQGLTTRVPDGPCAMPQVTVAMAAGAAPVTAIAATAPAMTSMASVDAAIVSAGAASSAADAH